MRVLILGASGFVGRHLAAVLHARGDEVLAGSLRNPEGAASLAATCEAIVNLAGEPLAQRWSTTAKTRIEGSRVDLPHRLLEAIAGIAKRSTRIYVSASAIGYYGTSESDAFTESSPPGNDFLARVCIAWEREALRARELGMRVAIVRSGVALGNDGGVLAKLLPAFRSGLGGGIGSGRQWISWIHIDDLVGAYVLALEHAEGPLNATAPNPVTNAEFTRGIGSVLHRPTIVPIPTAALRMMLGEGADMLLEGQRVLPERTLQLGLEFAYPELSGALANLLRTPSPPDSARPPSRRGSPHRRP